MCTLLPDRLDLTGLLVVVQVLTPSRWKRVAAR
jgi:hypothetical protein